MRFYSTMLACLLLPLLGCNQKTAPSVSTEEVQAAKEQMLKMNDEYQKKLEQLTLPGQD
jgi:hypothetical protein